MESELKVFVGKRNSDHYLAFDEEMNSYLIYGLYFQVGFFYSLDLKHFSKVNFSEQQDFLEIPTNSFLSPFARETLDKPTYKLSYLTSSSSSVNKNPSSNESEKGKQYQLFNYQNPFVETNPFDSFPVLEPTSPLVEWIKKKEIMEHTLLAVREGSVPNKKKYDLFVGNLKVLGRREIKIRNKKDQNNIELQIEFWNDLVCNKAKIIFWNVLDPIPTQTSILLNLEQDKVISFIGVYHLDSFVGQSSKSFITVAFDQIWTVPFFIQTKAFLEFDGLLGENENQNTTIPQMAKISTDVKRMGKDWQGFYFPFILAGPNEMIRITNTKVYQTTNQEEKMLMVLNQIDPESGAEYEIEIWNGSVDNVNPIFLSLKNGKFSFIIII